MNTSGNKTPNLISGGKLKETVQIAQNISEIDIKSMSKLIRSE